MTKQEELSATTPEIEQLEALAFHFTQLSKRLAQDCEHWAATGQELTQAVANLQQVLQRLTELEPRLKDQVVITLSQESKAAVATIAEALSVATEQVLTEQLKTTADDLKKIVNRARETLMVYQGQVQSLKRWWWLGLIASSCLSSLLAGMVVYYIM